MRLLCPHCQQPVTLGDDVAGKTVTCPSCSQAFAAPQLYASPPPVDSYVLAPPPALPASKVPEPPTVAPATKPEPSVTRPYQPSADVAPAGFAHQKSIPLHPTVFRWLPAAALTLAFLLTFFPWAGMYPAGYAAYTQNAWDGLFAGLGKDKVADNEMKLEPDLREKLHSNWSLLLYLWLLVLALALAWAGPLVDRMKFKLPAALNAMWKFRPALLAILATLTLIFLLAQWASGFGIQKAGEALMEARHADAKTAANTPEQEQRWEMGVARDVGALNLRTTFWLRLAALAHLVALLAVAGEAILQARGQKPPPRVGIMW